VWSGLHGGREISGRAKPVGSPVGVLPDAGSTPAASMLSSDSRPYRARLSARHTLVFASMPILRVVAFVAALMLAVPSFADEMARAPVRLAIVGLVHGHVRGFLDRLRDRADVALVGIADPDADLRESYRDRYHLRPAILFATPESMLEAVRPDAVAIFTSTFDHPAVV